jgi:hypothetical protein
MKMIYAVWLLILLSSVSLAQTQSKTLATRDKQDKLRASGSAALQRVKDSMKTDRCARYGSGVEAVECLSTELNTVEQDERIYAGAVGGMLRLVDATEFKLPSELADYKTALGAGGEFDAGEVIWRGYKKKTCTALYDSYAGGSIRSYAAVNCRLSLTQNHVLEMKTQYSNLWH